MNTPGIGYFGQQFFQQSRRHRTAETHSQCFRRVAERSSQEEQALLLSELRGTQDASKAAVARIVPNALFRQGIFTYETTAASLVQLNPDQVRNLDPQQMFYNENHSIQIRAEAFNVTNSVRFDVNQMSLSLSNSVAFGKYNGTLNSPRVFQFGARYEF